MVLVLADRVALRHARILERQGVGQPLAALVSAHWDRTLRPVEVVATKVEIGLQFVEVGQTLHEAPLVVAPLGPAIVVLRDAPEQDLPIDRAGAACGPSTGDLKLRLLRRHLAGVAPVVRAVCRQPDVVAELEVVRQSLEVRVVRTRLQQQHRAFGVLRQPRRYGATRRACSHYDNVVLHRPTSLSLFPFRRQHTRSADNTGLRRNAHCLTGPVQTRLRL